MKKTIVFLTSAVIIFTATWHHLSKETGNLEVKKNNPPSLVVDMDLAPLSEKAVKVLPEPNKTGLNKDSNAESAVDDATDYARERSRALQVEAREFNALDATAKLERRKTALSKVISGQPLDVAEDIALQQSWQRERRAEPGYQHQRGRSKININGTAIDVAQPGIIVPNAVMIHLPKGQDQLLAALAQVAGIESIEPVFKGVKAAAEPGKRDLAGWQRVAINAPAERVTSIVNALRSFEGMGSVEPVFERRINAAPVTAANLNDSLIADQWHLDAANVKAAWNHLEANNLPAGGDASVTVAVIDTGVDYAHPDLAANMWVNAGEVPDNGVDDDQNGFVDDLHGADVLSETYNHSGDPKDDNGHGTHVAGIIASTGGNNIGGVGIAYNTKIMAIKAAQYSGVLTSADIAEAIYYAVDNGADIINMSFAGYGRSQVEEDAFAIAYSQAVLVAAAGNDGKPNQAACYGAPTYPASYAWVLGVMAHTELPNDKGDYLAGFSNRDCQKDNAIEYELMAPGAQIMSTLPNEGYSAWSGTSMAAPVAAGIAALARTKWPDKGTHSSRFIMGQVAATGGLKQAYTPVGSPTVSYRQADALKALTSTPQPELTYEQHWLFDEVSQSTNNDGDGRIDAGETIELAIVVRNRWGKADNMVATLSTPSGASGADPYVTFVTAAVDYGAVGSFNKDDNGIEYDQGLLVTGARNPFVFSVAADTPNNHVVPFTLTMTASNGMDPADTTSYSFTSSFSLVVQRGRELPSILDGDAIGTNGGNIDTDGVENGIVTLDDSALWIIDKPVLVAQGTTVKVTEGAQLQFWSSLPDDAYILWRNAYLQVEGSLDILGTASNPVTIAPSALFPTRAVHILKGDPTAKIHMSYAQVANLVVGNDGPTEHWDTVNYNLFKRLAPGSIIYGGDRSASGPSDMESNWTPLIPEINGSATGNRFLSLGFEYPGHTENETVHGFMAFKMPENYNMSLLNSSQAYLSGSTSNSVLLKNNQSYNNRSGNRVYLGSEFSSLSTSTDYAVVEPLNYNGKTYAFFYSHEGSDEEKIAAAQAYARSLGGYLMTVSSYDEIDAVNNWMIDTSGLQTAYWEETYPLCVAAYADDHFCRDTLGNSHPLIGLIRQADGSYTWDGGEPSYDWLATQRKWDPAAYAISHGQTPNASDLSWEPKVPIAQLWLHQKYESASSSSWGLWNPNSSLGGINRFIIELPSTLSQADLDAGLNAFKANKTSTSFFNNAILNVWQDLNPRHWGTITAPNGDTSRRWDLEMDISDNFWGGASDALVDIAITDFNDNFNLVAVKYKPTLTVAPATTYPFVVNVELTDGNGAVPDDNKFGSQESIWRVTFNRDMDTSKQPLVTFGAAEPFTDVSIPGDWVDARTWRGAWAFNALTGDGWQNIRVAGAVAANNPWLVTGDDSERFRFEVITSGTEALSLQASGGIDKVSLSWVQDDFELLQGYNLYRSSTIDGQYTRINTSVINKATTAYIDTDVSPGIPQYYYFTVSSDGDESGASNIAVATPSDTIPPVVIHQPVSVVSSGSNLTLRATVTDNIAVTGVNIVLRNAASSSWQTRTMVNTQTSKYSITIEPSAIGGQYLEYYIEGIDSFNTALSGSETSPHKVYVSLPSNSDTDGDGVNNATDDFPYDPNEFNDLDNDGIGDNADEDDDGDSVKDVNDAFPEDASEWQNTDGDDLGNNADSDDDNDGVLDYFDAFPLDARGSSDTDGDGLPNQWETDNGLDPNDGSDGNSDLDLDGFSALEEFTENTSPSVADQKSQIVYYRAEPFIAGVTNIVQVYYRPSDGVSELNGLGVRVHFNSQLINSLTLQNPLLLDIIATDSAPSQDSPNFDNDQSTDSYVTWAAYSPGSWPGTVPIKLFDLAIDFSEDITPEDEISIRFSSTSTHTGYGFSGTPLNANVHQVSLDIDGNGMSDAMTDGVLILRNMFGFSGDSLIKDALSIDAEYTSASEIQTRINGLGLFLDIDGNNRLNPLTDGLLIFRYLFGIKGAPLTQQAIGQDATRTKALAIESYLSKIAPDI